MYREILVYTSTGDSARRVSEYASVFAATLKAQLTGVVVGVDFIEYLEIDRALTESDKKSAFESFLEQRTKVHDTARHAGALFETMARPTRCL
jgi:nucleotide-binding universal stress UspA family protein